jgi:hypothetical protein
MKEDGKDGFVEKDLELEEEDGKPECAVIVLVITVTLAWYLLHLLVSRKCPRLAAVRCSGVCDARCMQPDVADVVCVGRALATLQ